MAYEYATGAGRVSGNLERRQVVRAAIGSTIGTIVEWYDAILYGLLVPFYLGHLFFPASDPLASTLAGYLGLGVSFTARFFGAAFFGRLGDRVGRKATLVMTLLLGGVASALIGLLPTYAQFGVLAPVLLLLLRACVGFALGGEWGGAVLLTLEWGNHRRPVRTVLRRHPREVILTALLMIGVQVPLVLVTTFFLVYTAALHVPMATVVAISIWSGLVGVVCTPLAGYVSDLIGRRKTYFCGALLMALFALPYFALLSTGDVLAILFASILAQVFVATMSGPQAALIAESFTGRLRYSGASLGAGLGAPLGGGVASALGVVLFQRFHST